jgi:hypothetical protein
LNASEDISNRLILFLETIGVGNNEFAKSVGVSKSYLAGLKKGSAMGVDKLLDILNTYPQLSPQWLLLGVGDMLFGDNKWQLSETQGALNKIKAREELALGGDLVKEADSPPYASKRDQHIMRLRLEVEVLKEALREIGKGIAEQNQKIKS